LWRYSRIVRGKKEQNMTQENQDQEKTFTQADIDNLKAEHQKSMDDLATKLRAEFKEKESKAKADAEKAAKQANMSEIEKANERIKELEGLYQAESDKNALTVQRDETRKLMAELGVDEKCLDFVFVPKDTEGTKAKIKALKTYIDDVKKNTFEKNVKSTVPGANGSQANTEIAAMRKAAGLSN
jgi:hypothetical protein